MKAPSIKENYLYRTFYEVLAIITPLITAPYIARVLGADQIGTHSYMASIMSYFTLVAALGTSVYGKREISMNRDDPAKMSKLFWEIELMTVGVGTVCLAGWIILALCWSEYTPYLFALTPSLISTMLDIHWLFSGLEHQKYSVIRNTVCKLLGIAMVFTFIHDRDDLLLYMVLSTTITMLGNLSMWTYLPKFLVKVDMRTLQFRTHLKETMIYFIPAAATSIYTVLDKTLIGAITGNPFQNGYYEQANKIVKIARTFVYASVNSVMGARIGYLYAKGKFEEIGKRIDKTVSFILLTGVGSVFGIIGIAETFVPFFYGKGYEPVKLLLCVMAPLVVIIGVSNALGNLYFTPCGKRRLSARVIVLGAAVNLAMNLLLIPRYGAAGATVASIIAELTITVFYVQLSAGYMTWGKLLRLIWKKAVAGAVMCALVRTLGATVPLRGVAQVAAQILLGVAVYGALLLAMRDEMTLQLMGMIGNTVKKVGKRFAR